MKIFIIIIIMGSLFDFLYYIINQKKLLKKKDEK